MSVLRGDGYEVVSSRSVPALGPEATDDAIVSHAETEGFAVLSTDIKDFSKRTADAAMVVALQGMTRGRFVLPLHGSKRSSSILATQRLSG